MGRNFLQWRTAQAVRDLYVGNLRSAVKAAGRNCSAIVLGGTGTAFGSSPVPGDQVFARATECLRLSQTQSRHGDAGRRADSRGPELRRSTLAPCPLCPLFTTLAIQLVYRAVWGASVQRILLSLTDVTAGPANCTRYIPASTPAAVDKRSQSAPTLSSRRVSAVDPLTKVVGRRPRHCPTKQRAFAQMIHRVRQRHF